MNPRSPKNEIEETEIVPSSSSSSNQQGSSSVAKSDEKTIVIDPVTKDTYDLEKEIGSLYGGRCTVYKALYSQYDKEKDMHEPAGVVTLKTIDLKLHKTEFNEFRSQSTIGLPYIPGAKVIGSMRIFGTPSNLFCVSLPYMSEGSLRYILSTRTNKRLPEDFIGVVLKEVLVGLRDELHVEPNPRVHNTLNAGDIFVHIDDASGEMMIKLACQASVYDSGSYNRGASSSFLDPESISKLVTAPEVFGSKNDNSGPKSDIWLLGIMALELAYGVLPVRNREDLDRILEKLRKKRKFPRSLEKLLIVKKRKSTFKKAMNLLKPKEKVFSKKFERMVRECLAKNPRERPTAAQLLSSSFFTIERDIEKFKRFVLSAKKNPVPTDNCRIS
ncbi:putative STE20-related kinase adapter protein alpha-like [Capsicum annuum]|nr:putative STE20-related kinase adapter protein alpha-like [Capsicum annuum]